MRGFVACALGVLFVTNFTHSALATNSVDLGLTKKFLADSGEGSESFKSAVEGQAIAVTPIWDTQFKVATADACRALTPVTGQAVGGLPLVVSYKAGDTSLSSFACQISVTVGGHTLPDQIGSGFGRWGVDSRDTLNSGGTSATGIYVVGSSPYALLTVRYNLQFEGNYGPDTEFVFYVVRNQKTLEVFHGDFRGFTPIVINGNTLSISGFERMHKDDFCQACMPPESVSFDIDPREGRVHWHAKTPREVESVKDWLNEADPTYRAHEDTQDPVPEAATEVQSSQPQTECQQFIQAYQANDYEIVSIGYHEVHQFISGWDNMRIARGCAPVHESALDGESSEINNTVGFILQTCSGNPNMNMQNIAQAIYALNRLSDSGGYGSPGALPCP